VRRRRPHRPCRYVHTAHTAGLVYVVFASCHQESPGDHIYMLGICNELQLSIRAYISHMA
jgi:hypothetical protein